ncbi:unnamed protein product, partial [Strongylus vulgaris]
MVANTTCGTALQEDLRKYRQSKLLAAQGRRSLKKYRKDPLFKELPQGPSQLSCSAENITERRRDSHILPIKDRNDHEEIYTSLFRSSTPLSNAVIPTGDIPIRILPAEVCAAFQTMKAATAPGPDHVSVNLLRAEGHRLHEILAEHLASSLQKERIRP